MPGVEVLIPILGSSGASALAVWAHRKVKAARERKLALDAHRAAQAEMLEYVFQQHKPNGGSSMTDRLARIESMCNSHERSMRHMETRSRLSMTALDYGEFITDKTGRIISVNIILQRQTGRSPEELFGNGWINAVHESVRLEVMQEFARCVATERAYEGTFAWEKPGGRLTPVYCMTWPIRGADNQVEGFMAFVQKIDMAVYPPPE